MTGRRRTDLELALLRRSLHAPEAPGAPPSLTEPAVPIAGSNVSRATAAGLRGIGLVATPDSLHVIVGDRLPATVASAVERAARRADVPAAVENFGLRDELAEMLRRSEGGVRVEGGPVYVFTTVPSRPAPPDVHVLTSADPGPAGVSPACPPSWGEEEWAQLLAGELGPFSIAVDDDGHVLSCCHTPGRVTPEAAEAGVWTHPDHRGRRLAALTTSNWAQLLTRTGRTLFYSTDRDNAASQRVASQLGLRFVGWDWTLAAGEWPEGDAWGRALVDHHAGRYVPRVELETGDGGVQRAMRPDWFFRPHGEWDWWERELLHEVTAGPVLDLGAGAGRASLWLQSRGIEVTAVERSPLAARVCRARGVGDVRVGDLNEPPDGRWAGFLLLCGNLGLGGSRARTRALLERLARVAAPHAVLVGDTVDPRGPAEVRLRIRYRGTATPWWDQYNAPVGEIPGLVAGTGWSLQRHLVAGHDHAVLLRREPG